MTVGKDMARPEVPTQGAEQVAATAGGQGAAKWGKDDENRMWDAIDASIFRASVDGL